MADKIQLTAFVPKQTGDDRMFTCVATAKDILSMAFVDQARRDDKGNYLGFQRGPIKKHIAKISGYLAQDDAILPNSVVVGVVDPDGDKIRVARRGKYQGADIVVLEVDIKNGPCLFVVDGQQRVTGLKALPERVDSFEVPLSIFICSDDEELRQQFVNINSARPLPKAQIFEMLPYLNNNKVTFASEKEQVAATIIERLNNWEESSLKGWIKTPTHRKGIGNDSAFKRLIIRSLEGGALETIVTEENAKVCAGISSSPDYGRCVEIVSNFFLAVQQVYSYAWVGHKNSKTSRLIHGAGLDAIGVVMDFVADAEHAFEAEDFVPYLKAIEHDCAWTSGSWHFGSNVVIPWNMLEVTGQGIKRLRSHLSSAVKIARRSLNLKRAA